MMESIYRAFSDCYIIDAGERGAMLTPLQHGLQLGFITFAFGIHTAIGQVLNKSINAQRFSLLPGIRPKPDALNPAGKSYIDVFDRHIA